jgi:DNA repair photolyase
MDKDMNIKEIYSKSILSLSKVYPYVINPYVGCQHNCSYCYARFMKKYTGHKEPWGQFVDVKVNASELLLTEVKKKKMGKVWISGVCDPYQPLEKKYRLTRHCLEILIQHTWPIVIQTRSPLVLRDLDLFTAAKDIEVGLSVTTANDRIRLLFEPNAPPIPERIRALDELHQAGVRTYAMVAPMLPGAENLGELLIGKIDHILTDRMNYHYADWVYRDQGLQAYLREDYFSRTENTLLTAFQ